MPLAVLAVRCRHRLPPLGLCLLLLGYLSLAGAQSTTPAAKASESTSDSMERGALLVTSSADGGDGSLRQAILNANALEGPDTIKFDAIEGPFAAPRTIALTTALPELIGELTLDGYIEGQLWKATGVTVSGTQRHRVFSVAPGARVTIRALTIAEGRAQRGGGIANRGALLVKGVTFDGNVADENGGGLANLGGTATVINSTFVGNRAGNAGGGLADDKGEITVTHATFSANRAQTGSTLYSSGALLLRNSILANGEGAADCVATGTLAAASTHNLIETHEGCGEPISTADPRLGKLGYYNGSTRTLPLNSGSPAINLGDNDSAVDERGEPLRWDQRGNGDPRFVGGITDIGAFERQALPVLMVDTLEDVEVRACTRAGADCSLRGALTLANATPEAEVIGFDPELFSKPQTLIPKRPLPRVEADLTLDATGTGGVTLGGDFATLRAAPEVKVTLEGVIVEK